MATFFSKKIFRFVPFGLTRTELTWLFTPKDHFSLLVNRRMEMILQRARLFSFLFAALTMAWIAVDYVAFSFDTWVRLAALRVLTSTVFLSICHVARSSVKTSEAYRSLIMFFATPAIFYALSHVILSGEELHGIAGIIAASYALLPFIIIASVAMFPLTLLENLAVAVPIIATYVISELASPWPGHDLHSLAAVLWVLLLTIIICNVAGMSLLASMVTFVNQSARDPLTDSLSRRSGEEIAAMQFNLSLRSNDHLAVAFVDLDHFKSINDQFGHEAGDCVLANAARSIRSNLRESDALSRWGGEEFVVILPNTNMPLAHAVMSRLRQRGLGKRPDGSPVTASIGIAERKRDGSEIWQRLIQTADSRMYAAKMSGRDCIVTTGGMFIEGRLAKAPT